MKIPVLLAWSLSVFALGSPGTPTFCEQKTEAVERRLNAGDVTTLLLEAAVATCRADRTADARIYERLGVVYFRLNSLVKAESLFGEALTRDPKSPTTRLNLGSCLMRRGQYEAAIETTARILEMKIDKRLAMQAHFNIGLAHVKKAAASSGKIDAVAETHFRQALLLDPAFGGSHYYLGVVAETNQHDFEGAKAWFLGGCERNFKLACDALKDLGRRKLQALAPQKLPPENELRLGRQ